MIKKRSFWISLCLVNLCIVAFLGLCLRSKILFPLQFIDYGNILSAHSHFAFSGWAGLTLITLFIYDLLPQHLSQKKIYQYILIGIEVSSLGQAVTFPLHGYNSLSVFFSTLYIVAAITFAVFFIQDILQSPIDKTIKLLSIVAITCLLISFIGTLGIVYILISKSGNSFLYRDSIYTFLHFQYNGFFTCAVFALLFNHICKEILLDKNAWHFAASLSLSLFPSLFLSMLWHNSILFYVLALTGCIFIIISLYYFFIFFRKMQPAKLFSSNTARYLWMFSMASFVLKMLLNVGTIFPKLGNAVYGDRPVIIGFLHLVFLGFLSFFLLAMLAEKKYFTKRNKVISYPIIVFSFGIIANETVLMLQGLSILFKSNNDIYKWLLWIAAIILFTGLVLITSARFIIIKSDGKAQKKSHEDHGS